ncbi:RlpA-like double-psi beta-barrel-protein domain-containing protein-containing protein, partial [Mycena epipterygia]
ATYYYPNGGTGACGNVLQNTDWIVALSYGTWNSGANCGKTITVEYNGGSVSGVLVADLCPGCIGDGIDLSPAVMAALDSNYINDGRISVTWYFD